MITAIYVVLGLAFAGFAYRLARGPKLPDRVVGLDGMMVCGLSFIVVNAMDTGRGAFLQVAVMITLVNFIGTAVIARYIEGRTDSEALDDV